MVVRLVVRAVRTLAPLALALSFARAARAELVGPRLVLAGRVDGVVAAGGGVAALRDGQVILVGPDGQVAGGCRAEHATAGAPRRPDGTARSAEEVLHEAGLSDDDVSPEAEDLLDDEGVDPPSRHWPVDATSGAPRALALAASADAVWLGTVDGVWRLGLRDGACGPAGLGGQEIALVAARGTTVVALAGETVWRSGDGGTGFEVAAVLDSPAHALALAGDGETALLADEDGVVEVASERGLRRRLEGRVDALAACEADVVALADDGVHRLGADGGDVVAGPRPPVRALACDAQGLVAAGVGLWTSLDGAAWREAPAALGRSFSAVARAGGSAWLAGDDGLRVFEPSAGGAPPDLAEPSVAPVDRGPHDRSPPAWAGLLPRVAIAFDGWTESTGVAGWRLWVLLTVTLGRRWQRETNENLEGPP